MATNGFFEVAESSIGGVVFRQGDLFVEVSYIPESFPSYHPTIVVGFGTEKYDEFGAVISCMPMWFVLSELPTGTPEYSDWVFSNEGELRRTVRKIRESVLEIYGVPLWASRDELRQTIERFVDTQE